MAGIIPDRIQKDKYHSREIGARLKIARILTLRLKQSELAEILEIKRNTISRMEIGKTFPSFPVLAYMRKKGVPVNWLLTGDGARWLEPYEGPISVEQAGKRINRIRKKAKISIARFCRKLEISPVKYHYIINATRTLKVLILIRLLFLGVSADWILTGHGSPKFKAQNFRRLTLKEVKGKI